MGGTCGLDPQSELLNNVLEDRRKIIGGLGMGKRKNTSAAVANANVPDGNFGGML